jgi:hypothetical protein
MLQLTVSRPACLGIKHPSGAYDQICIAVRQFADFLMWGALSDERMVLSFVIVAGPCQHSHSQVESHILLSQIRDFLFRRLLRLAGLFDPASTRGKRMPVMIGFSLYSLGIGLTETRPLRRNGCPLLLRIRWNLLTESLLSNGYIREPTWKTPLATHVLLLHACIAGVA